MPGITALSDKRRLIDTLTAAYGEGAFGMLPRTFLLPEGYWDWRLWMEDHVRPSLPCQLHTVHVALGSEISLSISLGVEQSDILKA